MQSKIRLLYQDTHIAEVARELCFGYDVLLNMGLEETANILYFLKFNRINSAMNNGVLFILYERR